MGVWGGVPLRYPTMVRPGTAKGPVYPNRGVSTHTHTDGAGLIYRMTKVEQEVEIKIVHATIVEHTEIVVKGSERLK